MAKKVELFFDYASPWAYLADALLPNALAGLSIELKPIYLRGLSSFSSGMPYSSEKLIYIANDFVRCAQHHGVPQRPPAVFPVNGLHLLRAALAAKKLGVFDQVHRAAFPAVWAQARDLKSAPAVLDWLAEIGQDRTAFEREMSSDEIKERLKADTARAAERGVFGVPSFFVGDELFWGHDRLEYVARSAR